MSRRRDAKREAELEARIEVLGAALAKACAERVEHFHTTQIRKVEVVQVVRVTFTRGQGVVGSVFRECVRYVGMDGQPLVEFDPCGKAGRRSCGCLVDNHAEGRVLDGGDDPNSMEVP